MWIRATECCTSIPAAERLLNISADSIDQDITEIIQNDELIHIFEEDQRQILQHKPIDQISSKKEGINLISEVTLPRYNEQLVLRIIASPFLDENRTDPWDGLPF